MRTRVAGMDAIKGMEETEGPIRGGNAGRKKGTGVRAWLVIDAAGETQLVEAGKHAIMSRTGLPARDMRILDPQLSYLSTILGRERAIVVNLEHIKAIVTAEEVLLLNPRDPAVAPLVAELQRRLPNSSKIAAQQEGDDSKKDTTLSNEDSLRPDSSDMKSLLSNSVNNGEPSQHQNVHEGNFRERPGTWKDALNVEMNAFENCGAKVLPFEFRALEACLEATCSCLESETRTLEEEAYPTMDELTSKISTLNLGKVRQIKSRLVAISGRVQKVRDALEDLLDDDEDMAEMYLTDKLMQQHLDGTSSLSSLHRLRGGIEYGLIEPDAQEESGFEDLSGTVNMLSRDEDSSTSSSIHSGTKRLDVEELEMLLEAYFVQIDGTLNKLSTLREYVDDTEDYINIMLDDKQNQLLQMGVMLTLATLAIGLSVAATAVFGMNITIPLTKQDDETPPHYRLPEFLWTVGGCVTGSTFLYIVAIAWCKHRRLLML